MAGTKKRASSPTGQQASKVTTAPADAERVRDGDTEMGEFEDPYEDEFEDDQGEVIDAASDDDDDEEMAGEGGEMDLDGEVAAAEPARSPSPQTYLPGTALEPDQFLAPDLSTYPLLHSFQPTWPSLSFDVLRDAGGEQRRGYPVDCCLVSGTQAGDRTADELTVMRWEGLSKTRKEDANMSDDDDDNDDDDDDEDADPVLTFRTIPHKGAVNRIRARPLPGSLSAGPPTPPDPYHVATFAETGKVHIYDIAPQLDSLLHPATASALQSKEPLFTIDAHGTAEGYALDWSTTLNPAHSPKLLSGDVAAKIFLTTLTPNGANTSAKPFTSHTSSVEDLQWSPAEPTVFASCSADRSIRIWDTRIKNRQSVLAVGGAHDSDVNVISWNRLTNYLMLSGGEEGAIKVWDLRQFQDAAPSPVASFNWHKKPVTSVEWHPTEESCFAASGADDQVTLWDLSVEVDDEERAADPKLKDVPAQLLFSHQGQRDIKEVHWHPQLPGVVLSTALDGFNIFRSLPFSQ